MISTLRILGCSGGIGNDLRTTSFLLDKDILIDAGTGVADLTLHELRQINHIFVTHSHLDHIACIPLIADSIGSTRHEPIMIYGLIQTLEALSSHIFNGIIWPDFTSIPSTQNPFIRLVPINLLEPIKIDHRSIVALPVQHSVPANAYAITSGSGNTLVFTGDTGKCTELWQHINQLKQLKHLIVEASFNDNEEQLATISGHYSPNLLLQDLKHLRNTDVEIWITHLKPDGGEKIYEELLKLIDMSSSFKLPIPRMLQRNTALEF